MAENAFGEKTNKAPRVETHNEEFATEGAVNRSPIDTIRDRDLDTRSEETAGRGWAIFGIILAIIAFFMAPVFFGAAGIILGFIGRRRGAISLGTWAIGLGIVAIIWRYAIGPLI